MFDEDEWDAFTWSPEPESEEDRNKESGQGDAMPEAPAPSAMWTAGWWLAGAFGRALEREAKAANPSLEIGSTAEASGAVPDFSGLGDFGGGFDFNF